MKNAKIEEVLFHKGGTGNVYYIACLYLAIAFKGRGVQLGVYSKIEDAYTASVQWLEKNKDFTSIDIRREELWCDNYEEALAVQYDGSADVSSPIITIEQKA